MSISDYELLKIANQRIAELEAERGTSTTMLLQKLSQSLQAKNARIAALEAAIDSFLAARKSDDAMSEYMAGEELVRVRTEGKGYDNHDNETTA